jgi:G patch domain-containing protein 1
VQAIFSDDSDDDTDEILNHQPVDPVKTSEGANMALNRLAAEDFLESLGKEFGLEVPPERPTVQVRSETLSVAGAGVSSENEKIATTHMEVMENQSSHGMVEGCIANEDAPLANAEKLDLKYVKREHRTEESRPRPLDRQNQQYDPNSDSSSEWHKSRKRSHHRTWSRTPLSDSSTERHSARRRKSHSRHRRARNRSPDADSPGDTQHDEIKRKEKRRHQTCTPDTDSSDHEYKERSKSSSRRSSDKDRRSKKHSRHHKHRRKDHAEYS